MSSDIILDVRKLEKNYNTTTHEGKENIYSVLKGISFQVHKGEFISIMGSSGCGETTLLKILGMLSEPKRQYFEIKHHTCAKCTKNVYDFRILIMTDFD